MPETVKEKIDLTQNRAELRRKLKEISKESGQPFNEIWKKFMSTVKDNQKLKKQRR